MHHLARAAVAGLLTFAVAYAGLMSFAVVRFTYYRGPLPDLLIGVPVPLVCGIFAAVLVIVRTNGSA